MIDAVKANQKTKSVIGDIKCKAVEWANSEWDFVENTIEEAIAQGKFEANYWWSYAILKEVGIPKQYAAEALKEKASYLGFDSKVYQNCCTGVLQIELNWENI